MNKYLVFESSEELFKAIEDYCADDEIYKAKMQNYLPVCIDGYCFTVCDPKLIAGHALLYTYNFEYHTPVPTFNRRELMQKKLLEEKERMLSIIGGSING